MNRCDRNAVSAPTASFRGPRREAVGLAAWAMNLTLALAACATITAYDPTSDKNATDLKAEALLLMDKAKEPPVAHAAAIEALRVKLNQAYEYEKGKGGRNRVTTEQWRLLADPDGNLLGGFLRKWETQNTGQSEIFLEEAKRTVGQAFDEIIELESHKVRD